MIAHPPCTYLTCSAEWAYKEDTGKAQRPGVLYGSKRKAAREEALEFVTALWNAPIEKVCIENPVGVINSRLPFMPKPQYIQPYEFGEDASKKTGFWLRGLPKLEPTERIHGRIINGKERFANQTDSGQNRLPPSATRGHDRSRTYFGIAYAMADQWGALS